MFELLDETEEIPDTVDAAGPRRLRRGTSRFDDVLVRVQPERPLIEDLTLDVKPGQTIAIVGPTGAGKTTLVNLLMRFYEIDGGRITVDGVDIRDLTPRRPAPHVRHGPAGHLAVQRHHPRQHRLRPRRRDRGGDRRGGRGRPRRPLHPDPARRATTRCSTRRRSNVSAGEKQLLTIARAILADPPILILDEATSSVDTRTEVLIQQAMARLMKGRTSFVIAHRLSTIRDADTILVMDARARSSSRATTRSCSRAAASTATCTTASSRGRSSRRSELSRPRRAPASSA